MEYQNWFATNDDWSHVERTAEACPFNINSLAENMLLGLLSIAKTTRGYPNANREGEIARQVLEHLGYDETSDTWKE